MSLKEEPTRPAAPPRAIARASVLVVGLMLSLLAIGAIAFFALRPVAAPPPAEIANDPLLVEGRELFLSRCVSCHGTRGKGDGPIAAGLSGPPPGDLTDNFWKHGDRPEQVVRVISNGIQGTAMSAWSGSYSESQIRALAAYVYQLAGQPVPAELRGAVAEREPSPRPATP
jgi:cytochrome c oxidase cbb3-type subunit 3